MVHCTGNDPMNGTASAVANGTTASAGAPTRALAIISTVTGSASATATRDMARVCQTVVPGSEHELRGPDIERLAEEPEGLGAAAAAQGRPAGGLRVGEAAGRGGRRATGVPGSRAGRGRPA